MNTAIAFAESNRPSAAPGNYIRISRELEDHPIVGFGQPVAPADPSKGSYSRAEAWIFLVFHARWQTAEVNNRGKVITLERGELLGARAWLARVWNWTEKQVRGFLDRLEADMMIDRKKGQSNDQSMGQKNDQKSAHFTNIISICKYDVFQEAIEAFCEEKGHSRTNQKAALGANERANQGPQYKERGGAGAGAHFDLKLTSENKITPLSRPPMPSPSDEGQHQGISRDANGIYRAINGSRAPLEQILGKAGNLDEVLIEISPKLPDKLAGQELALALAAAVADHVRELEKIKQKKGTRLNRDWRLTKAWGDWATKETGLDAAWVRSEADKFRDHWLSQPGTKATKLDWERTWWNWIRNAKKPLPTKVNSNEQDRNRSLLDRL